MNNFKLVRVMMGSGWPSAHIAIDCSYTFPDKAGGAEQCLTLDAENFAELSAEIDDLIAQLEVIRSEAPDRIMRWKTEWERGRVKSNGSNKPG